MKKLFLAVVLLFMVVPGVSAQTHKVDYGKYSSMELMTKAWNALEIGDKEAVLAYTNKCIELYERNAKDMQATLTEFPTGEPKDIHKYWALNDVATAYFIQGEMFLKEGEIEEAKKAYQRIIDDYFFGQCWNPEGDGFFWRPAYGAQMKLAELE